MASLGNINSAVTTIGPLQAMDRAAATLFLTGGPDGIGDLATPCAGRRPRAETGTLQVSPAEGERP